MVLRNQLNGITKFSAIGIPTFIGFGIAWVSNKLIKNEKRLKEREIELKFQLNDEFH